MTTIGFIGLGSMGTPLAARLLPGNQVYGTNRTTSKAEPLIEQGLRWRDTPREGILLAERGGIDPARAVRALTESAIGSPMLKTRIPLVLDLPEQAWFDVSLLHKDIRLALETARASGVPLPAAAAADSVLSQAEKMGYGHRDIAGLYQVLARMTA